MRIEFESLKDLSKRWYSITIIIVVVLLALTPYLSKIASQALGNNDIIKADFRYGNSAHDPQNDGIEPISNAMDFEIFAQFPFELNDTNLATKYEVYSLDDEKSTIFCYGSQIACSYLELVPSSENWNDTLYLYYGKDGATSRNIIGAQVFYVEYNISANNPYTQVYDSEVKQLRATFLDLGPTYIENVSYEIECENCLDNKVLVGEEFNLKIIVNGNMSNSEFRLYVPIDFSAVDVKNAKENSSTEQSTKYYWNLIGQNEAEESMILSAPGEVRSGEFFWEIEDKKGSFALEAVNLENETNKAPQCIFPLIKAYKDETTSIRLSDYCTDNEHFLFQIINSTLNAAIENGILNAISNQVGSNEADIAIMDSANTIFQKIFFDVVEKESLRCSEIPNMTIGKNSNLTINMSEFCKDLDERSIQYFAFEMENVETLIDREGITFIPNEGFIGIAFTFITADNSKDKFYSNTFMIDVMENSATELLIQSPAEIEKPVKWVKTVEYQFEEDNISVEISKDAYNITVKDEDENILQNIDVMVDGKKRDIIEFKDDAISKVTSTNEELSAFARALSIFASPAEEDENAAIIVSDSATQVNVEYLTEAPAKEEQIIDEDRKIIKIVSDMHYENVLAFTDIPESKQNAIKLYWIKDGAKELFENVAYLDTNNDTLIDRIEWVVPHLSNQTFEVDLRVLDVQSYPVVGGNWQVRFNTSGTANLTISAINDTAYSEKENDDSLTEDDLEIVELKCGNNVLFNYQNRTIAQNVFLINDLGQKLKIEDTLNDEIKIKSIFVGNFNCENGTGYWNVRVLTPGVHNQMFIFGDLVGFANNFAINGLNFTDTTEDDFGQGTRFNTNVTGSGASANVTLNFTTISTLPKYNFSGNFTSRVFDSGQNHTVYDKIAWTSDLVNTTDVMSYALDTNLNDMIVLYRNGSFGIDTSVASFNLQAITVTNGLRRLTLPTGWDLHDILGASARDDGTNVMYLIMRNGSTLQSNAYVALDNDITLSSTVNTWTITPVGFNKSDIIGFTIDSAATQAAIFFKNGSYVSDTNSETPPFDFNSVFTYTLPAGFTSDTAIGVELDTTANDIAMFFRNGSYLADGTMASLGVTATFAIQAAVTYQSDLNLTAMTNISLQTRVSNDTSIWTSWSNQYVDPEGTIEVEDRHGRYIQYKALFKTPSPYRTPRLENVSINYSIDIFPPNVSASLNNTFPRFNETINFTANISDPSSAQWCQFIINQSANGAKEYYNISISGRTTNCTQNFTMIRTRGNVINLTLLVNDTYNNINRTQFIITIANTAPNAPNIVYPSNDVKANMLPLALNVTGFDVDGDALSFRYYINGLANSTSTGNSTLNASDGVYILNVSAFDTEFSFNSTINFTIDTILPIVNGTLNKTASSIIITDVINATFNATDFVGLSFGQIVLNDTGAALRRYFNFSLNDQNQGQFSQNFTISCAKGCVINVTGIVNDSAGNPKQNSTIFTVANNPPAAPTIVYPPNNAYTNRQPLPLNVTFANDLDNDAITINYYINARINDTSPFNTTFNASDGTYILNVSLFDGLDTSENASSNFTIDTKNPSISLIYPFNATYNSSGFLQMQYIPNDLYLDKCALFTNFSGIWRENQTDSPTSGSLSSFNQTAYTEGLYIWNVRCNDSSGNFAFNSTNYTVIVDINNPKIVFTDPTPLNNTNTSSTSIIFNVTHSDNNPSNLTFSLNLSSPNETMDWSSSINYTNLTKNNLHGTYSFYFWLNDSAGRFNQTETRTINVDIKPPLVTSYSPGNNTWNNSALMLFFYDTTDDFLGTKNCSLEFDLQDANKTSNITQGTLTGAYDQTSGSFLNLSKADNSSFFYVGSETGGVLFETSAYINLTFNLSGINPSMISRLIFDFAYCHSGNPESNVKCNGVAPTGAVELDQTVSIFNYSSQSWVAFGTLNNSQRGTNGNIERKILFTNGTSSDFINSTSNQVKLGIRAHFNNVLGENTFLVLDMVNLTPDTKITSTNITDGTLLNFTASLDSGYYNWNVECNDYVANKNSSHVRIIKMDKTFPYIFNETVNDTSISITEKICLNASINDTFSGIQFVYAEIDRPVSENTNISLTNDTLDPNSCSGVNLGNVWSYAYQGNEEGQVNWTTTYAIDFAGNVNSSKKFGLNWTKTSNVFLNSTKLAPLLNFEINESEPGINYTFTMLCNATCRMDSDSPCESLTIFPQYDNGTWNDINNFSTQLIGFTMNKTCGNIPVGEHCNATFNVRSSTTTGNKNFSLRCRAKGSNTPNDFSNETNVTINDHPAAIIDYPSGISLVSFARGIINVNSSSSFDDQNITRYLIELDDNSLFSSPSTICDNNESNCTFNTFAQTQCVQDTPNCFLRLNTSDVDGLYNSTFIQIQIDNTAPSVRLEDPLNSSYLTSSNVDFHYTPFDTNISTCTIYHNESGTFSPIETNEDIVNASLDEFTFSLQDSLIIWNVLCNDSAGNSAFNSSNYTLTIDTIDPKINFTNPTLSNNTYIARNYILVNVSVNETNFANITFFLYNSSLQLVNETNFTTPTFFLNFSNLADSNELYYYNVTIRDRASRINSTQTRQITLDNLHPRINFTNPTLSNNTYVNNRNIIVNVSLNETNFANVSFYLYDASLNLINQTNFTMTSDLQNISINFSPQNLNQRYYYNVTVIDKTGLYNFTETRQIVLDNTTPAIKLNGPGNNTLTLTTLQKFNFTPTEANLKNCSLFANFSQTGEFKENSTSSSVVAGTHYVFIPETISDGVYIWNVQCFDLADNSAFNSTNYTIEIDTTSPAIFNLDQPANFTESQNRSPILNWTEAFDVNFRNYTVFVDNAIDFSSVDFAYKLSGNYSNNTLFVPDLWTGNTQWYWKVIAYDLLNQSAASTDYFYYAIDNGTPQVNLSAPRNGSTALDSIVDFKFNATDQFTVTNCTLIINNISVSTSDSISKTSVNTIQYGLTNGNYIWSVNCSDKAGNINNSLTYNLTVNAPPLLPMKFVDTTDTDFGQGTLFRTNITGSGNPANVTLNYTVYGDISNPRYNTSGNFTSRIFDFGTANANISMIASVSNLKNTTDVMCAAVDTGSNDAALFLRNGTHIVEAATVASLIVNRNFNVARAYTISGYTSFDDIVGCSMDDDANDMVWLLMRNGSAIRTIDLTATGMDQNIAFTVYSTWSMPSGFNASDIIGFTIIGTVDGGGNGNSSLFFANGTHLFSPSETGPFVFTTHNTYSLPSGFTSQAAVAVTADDTANDVAIFFNNGSYAADSTQGTMNGTVAFANGVFSYAVLSGVNTTESTNISIITRASNDTVTWTEWSSIYDLNPSQIEQTTARYIQYRGQFLTQDIYLSPDLENVTVNYTERNNPRINFSVPTPNNNSFIRTDYFYINTSIIDEHSIDRCTLEFDNVNQSMLIDRDGRNASCFINKTSLSDGKYGFRVYANDTFSNMNFTETRNVTIDTTSPIFTLFAIDPNPAGFTYQNVSVNFTASDLYLNSTVANVSYPNGTTFSIYFLNFTLTPVNLSVAGNYSIRLFANDTAGNSFITVDYLYVPDVTVPNVTLVAPLNNTFTNNRTIIFYYVPKDDFNVSNCSLIIDGRVNATNYTITETINNNITANFSDGQYTWMINCTDSYQNTNFSEFRIITVDATPPNITLSYPVNDFNSTVDYLVFNWTPSDTFDINVTCNLTINNVKYAINITNTTATHINFTAINLSDGTNMWNATCFDDLNNTNTSITRNFTIVNGPSLVNATLTGDNESINITWISVGYAESYNLYMKDSFDDDFGPTPNFTMTHTNFTDFNAANKTTRFYKIATVKGSVNKTSTRMVGKYEFELLNNTDSPSDWVLFSLPLNITNFLLNNGTNNGSDLRTKPLYCIKTLWEFNETDQNFRRNNFNGSVWIPGSGSSNFTSLSAFRGYWAEINQTCNLTFVGEVPFSNRTIDLVTGWNVIGWFSSNFSKLPQNFFDPYPIVVNPANSVKAIDRYNPATDKFEVTVHFTVSGQDFGWVPSANNRDFTGLNSTKGYYYDVLNTATWTHRPVQNP